MRLLLFSLVAATLITLVLVIFFALSIPRRATNLPSVNVPAPISIVPINNTDNQSQKTVPQVKYDSQKADKLIDMSKNRQSLSQDGQDAKEKIINSLGNTSGIAYTSAAVAIEYIASPDLFQGMIKTASVDSAKTEAVNWFLQQGFTKSDVCRLPLSFYLTPQVSSQLKDSNTTFNPLPEGC